MGKFSNFVKKIGLDVNQNKKNKKFAEKFFKDKLYNIAEAVKAYNEGNFKDERQRYEYLTPTTIFIDDDEDEEGDDDPMDGSRGAESKEKEEERKIDMKNIEIKCEYVKDKVNSLKQVIDQDIEMIKKLAPQYECEYIIHSRDEKGRADDKSFRDNCLTICFMLDPHVIFKDPKIAYWHDIDFKRKICILVSFIYSMNLNPSGNIEIDKSSHNSHVEQLVSSLNECKTCEVIGFQTKENNTKDILNNYANDPKCYPKDSAVYPIAQFIREAIAQKGNRWVDDEVSDVLRTVQNISNEEKYYDISGIGTALNNDICALLLLKLYLRYPDKINIEIAVMYFTSFEESKHTLIYRDEMFDDFVNIKLYGEYSMFNYTTLRYIYVDECKRDLKSTYGRCDDLLKSCDASMRAFYFKESYINNTIQKEEMNLEFEKILIENSRYYFIIPLLLFIGKEISHRFKDLKEVSETYKCCNADTCKHQQERLNGYGLEDYIILHNYEFELLLSFYIAASDGQGRGFLNAPNVELPKQMSEKEIQKLIDEGDINTIKKAFASVVPEEYLANPEQYQQQVNDAMSKVISQLPSMNELIKLSDNHQLRKVLNLKNSLAYPLLRWIAFNSENMIVHLPNNMKWNGCDADHVFLIKKGLYKYEEVYKNLKHNGKSFRKLFHGSPYGCWHSILKNGIKIYSQTKYQTTGAAYGDGIYLSDTMNVSNSYSRSVNLGNKWKCRLGNTLSCAAIVEVNEGTYTTNGDIFVAKKEEEVFLRYLLVWSGDSSNSMTINGVPDNSDVVYNSIVLNQ